MQDNYLEKHRYPFRIKLFGSGLLLIFLYVTLMFFWIEFPRHRKLKNKVDKAERCFINKDYYGALALYTTFFEKYEYFGKARKRIIQCCFACSADAPSMYECGLCYLQDKEYNDHEVEELACYLPTDQQRTTFKSGFC